MFCLLVVLVNLYQYLPSDWLERVVRGSPTVARGTVSIKPRQSCVWFSLFTVLIHCLIVWCVCYFTPDSEFLFIEMGTLKIYDWFFYFFLWLMWLFCPLALRDRFHTSVAWCGLFMLKSFNWLINSPLSQVSVMEKHVKWRNDATSRLARVTGDDVTMMMMMMMMMMRVMFVHRTTTTRQSTRHWTTCSLRRKTTRVCVRPSTPSTTLTTSRWLSVWRSTNWSSSDASAPTCTRETTAGNSQSTSARKTNSSRFSSVHTLDIFISSEQILWEINVQNLSVENSL